MLQNMLSIKKYTLLAVGILALTGLRGQAILSPDEAVQLALARHPALQAADLQIQQAQQTQQAGLALPQPELTLESPTGNFYTVGINQSFDWPGSYRARKNVLRQQTLIAGLNKTLTANELTFTVRQAYLDWQYAEALAAWQRGQDSVFQQISVAADRQFQAGEIDFVQKTYAVTQALAQQQARRAAEAEARMRWEQVRLLTGLIGERRPQPLPPVQLAPVMAPLATSNPALLASEAGVQRGNLEVLALRQANRPGFVVGYINQGERNSPVYNRFRAGVTLPIWQKKYRAQVQAARTGVQAAEAELTAQRYELELAREQALAELTKWADAVKFHQTQTGPQLAQLRDAARRLFEAGENDFPAYLRVLNDVNDLEKNYWEALYQLNSAYLTLQYLNGN